ncbi:hypothetical protein CERSUDRAFT_110178 [Gelatoporia subvermispora B]|uniref:Uncharacterized protein n=1 Tax=Ceriporiopsis subvermispora (strain B) TaxID=914234 RepID=M2QWV1_CERS8|nr:hypothetical protein CERSUDRAFT_110178 [Gelatoporia subvermispora B]
MRNEVSDRSCTDSNNMTTIRKHDSEIRNDSLQTDLEDGPRERTVHTPGIHGSHHERPPATQPTRDEKARCAHDARLGSLSEPGRTLPTSLASSSPSSPDGSAKYFLPLRPPSPRSPASPRSSSYHRSRSSPLPASMSSSGSTYGVSSHRTRRPSLMYTYDADDAAESAESAEGDATYADVARLEAPDARRRADRGACAGPKVA